MVRVTIVYEVGRNLRRLRRAAGRSLADLATAAGISKTTLHGIEQGEANPTLGTLWALATALRVPLGELLDPPAPPVSVVRADQGPRADGEAVHGRLLHRIPVRGTVEVYDLRIDPVRQVSEPHLPGVQECLVVTGGRVATGPADDPTELGPGDSIRFHASVAHSYQGLEQGSQALLLMIYGDAPARTRSSR